MTDKRIHEQSPDDLATLMSGGSEPHAPPAHMAIAGYRLLREVNRGGQAVVYQAIQNSTGQQVAVKVLLEGPLAGPGERARLEREVQILGALRHPNIVSIIDRGITDHGWLFIVMEYIPGRPLDGYLAQRRASAAPPRKPGETNDIEESLRLFLKICDAVGAAHQRGIVHRDLKPSNILVDEHGEPHVVDFGLARTGLGSMAEAREPVTVTGQFIGSLPYASPEQVQGGCTIDARSDVYSLGIMLYQMLTGQFPYDVSGSMGRSCETLRPRMSSRPVASLARGKRARANGTGCASRPGSGQGWRRSSSRL